MTPRLVQITRRALRDLNDIEVSQRAPIREAIAAVAAGDPNMDVRKLRGQHPARWRIRVGRYRVIFAVTPGALVVERIADRRDVYR